MPDCGWVFRYFREWENELKGLVNGPDAFQQAKQRIEQYNKKHGRTVAKMEVLPSRDIVVAICDIFCQRVHEFVPQAGDIVLMDATSNLDRHDTKLFHLMIPNPAGGASIGQYIDIQRE